MSAHRVLYDMFKAPYAMADPGDAGTIIVTKQLAHVPVVTAGASETRILAVPTKPGIICTVEHKTDGGDFDLTVTSGYDQAANTAIAFADVGDYVTFMSHDVNGTYLWRVLDSEGTTLASVEEALSGVTAGTATASKAVVLGAAKEIATITTATITNLNATNIARVGVQRIINTEAKLGAGAGWTLGGGAVNTGLMATMAASQTAGTLVVPISGLKVGDTITAFSVVGQIESAGNTVTLDADLRKHTAAAADVTDASVGAITQISVTADAIVSSAKAALAEVVAADETFYVLLTGTTAASTDIALQGITVTVTEA